jgi:hypothetical protein
MIPKHKLSGLLLALKPKGSPDEGEHDGEEEEHDGHDEYEQELDTCVNEVADAIVSGKREAIVTALHKLHDCMVEEDEEKDHEEEDEEG